MQVSAANTVPLPPRVEGSDAISIPFSILGVGIHLEGRPGADVRAATQIYAEFQNTEANATWAIVWNGDASPTRLTVNGKVHPGLSRRWISALISTRIMDCVHRSVKHLYLFHGAAAAWRGVLLAFPGESGTGKSVLSVALARNGWSLFSDEIIAISPEHLDVCPFPRAIMIRESDAGLSGLVSRVQGAGFRAQGLLTKPVGLVPLVGGGTKMMIPFSFFNEPPAPLRLGAIVCLRGYRREARQGGREIVVTHWDESMEKLARQRGIFADLEIWRQDDFWCIRSDHTDAVEEICTSLGGIVIERDLIESSPPVFGASPVLEPISFAECLDALWPVFQNGRAIMSLENGAVGLYLRLARLFSRTPCFWLSPGPPSPTCELLRNLAEELTRTDRESLP